MLATVGIICESLRLSFLTSSVSLTYLIKGGGGQEEMLEPGIGRPGGVGATAWL